VPHVLKETAQPCKFYDNVFEIERKRLKLRALCFHPTSLPLHPALLGIKLSDKDSS
jgi:hypothetical protein